MARTLIFVRHGAWDGMQLGASLPIADLGTGSAVFRPGPGHRQLIVKYL